MELALARQKRDQKGKLEALRLEEEAKIPIETAKAIDGEVAQMGLDFPSAVRSTQSSSPKQTQKNT